MKQQLQTLERQKNETLSELASWRAARLRIRPNPAAWSAVEVIDHVVKTEVSALRAMQANLSKSQPVSLRDRAASYLVIGVMRSPLRVTTPASAKAVLPGTTIDWTQLLSHWVELRGSMTAFLESLLPSQLPFGLFQHPVGGWMTASKTLTFLSVHLRHHQFQLDRLKRESLT